MPFCILVSMHISQGRWGLRQLGGFSVVVVIVALFVPDVCPQGGGGSMWGIFGKPVHVTMVEASNNHEGNANPPVAPPQGVHFLRTPLGPKWLPAHYKQKLLNPNFNCMPPTNTDPSITQTCSTPVGQIGQPPMGAIRPGDPCKPAAPHLWPGPAAVPLLMQKLQQSSRPLVVQLGGTPGRKTEPNEGGKGQ